MYVRYRLLAHVYMCITLCKWVFFFGMCSIYYASMYTCTCVCTVVQGCHAKPHQSVFEHTLYVLECFLLMYMYMFVYIYTRSHRAVSLVFLPSSNQRIYMYAMGLDKVMIESDIVRMQLKVL